MAGHDDEVLDDDTEAVRLAGRAERDRSMVAHGRRLAGMPGAIMAGAMIAIRDIYEGPKDGQVVAISETPDEPHDVDRDGVRLTADDVGGSSDVAVPAQPHRAPVDTARRRRRHR